MTVPVLERYVDQRELAQLMGVSLRTIKRWTADGHAERVLGDAGPALPALAGEAWVRARADSTLAPPQPTPGTGV